ncbi:MAG: c-type cytochrome, partial [Proteobacteria bacterium]|nr:c-type cytochrome [Pseudomonadota bacterium]
DMETGRPLENPDVVYEKNPQWILPANAGAHNWEPMSFDASSGIMYFYYHDYPNFYALDENFAKTGIYKINPVGLSLGVAFGPYRSELETKAPPQPESKGFVGAFDPLTGQYRWRHALPSTFNGGVLATTTGLLFQGEGNGMFTVRNTDDGERLWEFDAKGSFSAPVISYMIEGTQYVASMVSPSLEYLTSGTLLVFKLNGTAVLPEPDRRSLDIPQQAPLTASAETLDLGNALYHEHCALCHRGLGVVSIVATATPDLRMMSEETRQAFPAIVLGGTKQDLGMPGFAGALNVDEVEAVRAFVASKAIEARRSQLEREQSAAPSG